MVINHLLTGMILQVKNHFLMDVLNGEFQPFFYVMIWKIFQLKQQFRLTQSPCGVGAFSTRFAWNVPRLFWRNSEAPRNFLRCGQSKAREAMKKKLVLGGGFKYFFMFIPIWGRFPFWLIFFRWVGSTTNQCCLGYIMYTEVNTFPGMWGMKLMNRKKDLFFKQPL